VTDLLDDDYARGYAVAARVSDAGDAMALARSVGLMMLHPLCVQTGRTGDALAWLARNGFRVFFLTGVDLTPAHVHRVWRREIPQRDGLRVQVFERLMTWHRAIVLGLVDQVRTDEDTSVRLSRLKGPSDSAAGSPDWLRVALGAANLLNNLVHTSDAPHAVIREASIILGERAKPFWDEARLTLGGEASVTVPPEITCAFDDDRGVSLAHVASAFRGRLLHRLMTETACDRCGSPSLTALVRRGEDTEEAWLKGEDSRRPLEVLHRYRSMTSAYAPRLSAAITCAHSQPGPVVTDLLHAVRGTESVLFGAAVPQDPRDFLSAADRVGVAADPREEIALMSEYAVARTGGGSTVASEKDAL
jgi:hypothetical protein